jgi:FKBP-type peptidyl-prolyl cis-trans isomerase SlyD
MKVEQNKIVAMSYRLEADGKMIETVTKEKPAQFMYGMGHLLPKFEEQIRNMRTGDTFDFILPAADAYGEINEQDILELSKDIFENEGKFDDTYVKIGECIRMQDQDGNNLYGVVEKIGYDTVTMNFNHPLAGNTLHFTGEIVNVREATPEGLSGGCSCCSNCHDDDCGCDCDC